LRFVHALAQHFSGAAQQDVACGVAEIIVHGFQAVEHVLVAQVFEIGFSHFPRCDVGERDQHHGPVVLVTGHDGELHVGVDGLAIQVVVDDFALLAELVAPQVDELIGEVHPHIVAEHALQIAQQVRLVSGAHHVQGLLVHVEHTDFLHAAVDEFGMDAQKGGKVGDALRAQHGEQTAQRAEVFHPQRHGRQLEHAGERVLADREGHGGGRLEKVGWINPDCPIGGVLRLRGRWRVAWGVFARVLRAIAWAMGLSPAAKFIPNPPRHHPASY